MIRQDNLYSTYVALAKLMLPLLALALLSTMFLFARLRAPDDDAIPYADLETLAREQRISAPSFSGVAEDGTLISISAESARPLPDRPRTLAIDRLLARMDSADGTRLTIRAGSGEVDNEARTARLGGLARVETSNGYRMEAQALDADLDAGRLRSVGPVEAQAPFGELTAGAMVVETPLDGTGARRMVFNEGVRLVYRPGTDGDLP